MSLVLRLFAKAPPVTVLLDAGDAAGVTSALLAAHWPAAGRVTVHRHPRPRARTPWATTCSPRWDGR